MRNNPYLNALAAALYIVIIANVMTRLEAGQFPERTILVPIFILSLFVLSAAVMGYLFLYQPFRLYFEDLKSDAVLFFLKTIGTFAGFVVLFFILLLSMAS